MLLLVLMYKWKFSVQSTIVGDWNNSMLSNLNQPDALSLCFDWYISIIWNWFCTVPWPVILNPRFQASDGTIWHHGFSWWWRIKAENGPMQLQLHFQPTWILRVCNPFHVLNFLFSPFILSTALYFILGSRHFSSNWEIICTIFAAKRRHETNGWAGRQGLYIT